MTSDPHESPAAPDSTANEDRNKPRIKIGSQREGAPPPRIPPRVKTLFLTPDPASPGGATPAGPAQTQQTASESPQESSPIESASQLAESTATAVPSAESQPAPTGEFQPKPAPLAQGKTPRKFVVPARTGEKVPPPNLRAELPPELAQELQEALGDMSVDDLLAAEGRGAATAAAVGMELELESRQLGKVVHVYRDDVFLELPGRNQGVVSIRQFAEPPEPGTMLDVLVIRFNAEEGLYEVSLPDAAVEVGDWSQVSEGMVVEANVTGHNKGGLEVEVNRIRGFIPVSQIATFRVEQIEQFVGQKFPCIVTEANPDRRNLVLSRRAMIEREQADAKKRLLEELAPGQVREGIVRSLRDFGAFVDLGGVDGLLHVSQISWDRIKHPGDVLQVGQKVRVKIEKIDPQTHKISLNLRDFSENPWSNVTAKYPATSRVSGTVSKLTEFGAFVRLEPGVEGLIHISELAHQRVFRASDVVAEGQEVEVKVISVDPEAQRISLSLKALQLRPEPIKKATAAAEEPEPPKAAPAKRKTPLKGGLGRVGDGSQFGLKW
ncbi:MAG TPA: S1 RNA-binding domain-containing protein [Pirellulales bacterium]|jgi:small subunit ribosomal protein S1|nr:S1 RNA-binding domain-containing protein [Pirellulales bacterium]